MTDATVLVPTHAHPRFLPYALRSALAQEGASIELFVVGDGVQDDTRQVLAPFLDDPRVRFFDRAKGERHGERLRHEALQEASGEIVCYLSDDDLLLPDHVRTMRELLQAADFAHGPATYVDHDGGLVFLPFDLARPEFVAFLRGGRNSIGLTGAAHTLAAYRRLPDGWRPGPPGVHTDLYMWQQFLGLPGFRGMTGTRLTFLHFPSPPRAGWTDDEREAELERWARRLEDPGFPDALQEELAAAVRQAAVDYRARTLDGDRYVAELMATRTFRLRETLLRSRVLRGLLARSP